MTLMKNGNGVIHLKLACGSLFLGLMLSACGGGSGGGNKPAASLPAQPSVASSSVALSSVALSSVAPSSQATSSTSSVIASSSQVSSSIASSSIAASSVASSSSTAPSSAASSSVAVSSAASKLLFHGVSLAGAEFGESKLPGVYNTDYTYPGQTSVDYFKAQGMNSLRLPFSWERLQPSLSTAFDATELTRLDGFVVATTAKDMKVIIDPHNYARYRGKLVGSNDVPNTAFADLWTRLATLYKDNDKVIFAIMNEPNTMSTEQWLDAANAAIAAIRATGATNLILVPGNGWTGAHSWTQNWYGTANATALLAIVDSGNNYAFEVHQYLDSDSSGTSAICVSADIGVTRLTQFTNWLYTNNKRGFLGELAGANNSVCNQAVTTMLTYMETHSSVWLGWTWWAAGPWWGNYMYSLEPGAGGADKPQMLVLKPFIQ